jgi:steroid delta-isomerase-like uncharacterized protein
MKNIFSLILILTVAFSVSAQNTEKNKELIRKFYDAFNKRDFTFFYSCFADSVILHVSKNRQFIIKPGDIKSDIDPQVKSIPDSYDMLTMVLAEQDWVSIYVRHTGTYKDSLWGLPPNGKFLDYPVMEMYRVENGKIKEVYVVGDRLSMFTQMGIIPDDIKGVLKNP